MMNRIIHRTFNSAYHLAAYLHPCFQCLDAYSQQSAVHFSHPEQPLSSGKAQSSYKGLKEAMEIDSQLMLCEIRRLLESHVSHLLTEMRPRSLHTVLAFAQAAVGKVIASWRKEQLFEARELAHFQGFTEGPPAQTSLAHTPS